MADQNRANANLNRPAELVLGAPRTRLRSAEHQLGTSANLDDQTQLMLGGPEREPASADPGSADPGSAEPGSAEHQLGTSDPARGWYSRGYLPHCDHPGLLQVITYRLADSLPREDLERLDAELRHQPKEKQDSGRRRRIEAWMDAGRGSCVLRQPDAAACVVDTWRHFAGARYDMIAWVVMPNHVHVLIRTYEGVSLARIVQSWKSYTARRIGEMIHAPEAQGLWMRDYWDRYIRDERHFAATLQYIHLNPVTAGLVETPNDWPWSSSREFSCGEDVPSDVCRAGRRAELVLGAPRSTSSAQLHLKTG